MDESEVRAQEIFDRAQERRAKAHEAFMEWFVENYPPHSVISNPSWHAEKIFRAAKRALGV